MVVAFSTFAKVFLYHWLGSSQMPFSLGAPKMADLKS